jgi:hypothetical protein
MDLSQNSVQDFDSNPRYNNTPMQVLGFLTPKEKRKISA